MQRFTSSELCALIRTELGGAADKILDAAAGGMAALGDGSEPHADAISAARDAFLRILEACSFNDLIGQRLSQLEQLSQVGPASGERDPLLNGPSKPGDALSQSAADAILAGD